MSLSSARCVLPGLWPWMEVDPVALAKYLLNWSMHSGFIDKCVDYAVETTWKRAIQSMIMQSLKCFNIFRPLCIIAVFF